MSFQFPSVKKPIAHKAELSNNKGMETAVHSLAPAIVFDGLANIWLYWTASFIGKSMVAVLCRKKFY